MPDVQHQVSFKGLNDEQVEASRRHHGANVLTPPKRPSLLKLYLEKFADPIVRILLVAAAASLLIGFIENDYIESIGIFCAIFLSTGIAFYFEMDAARRFDELNRMSDEQPVVVVRDGHYRQVARHEVVVGDIVVLEPGCEVPADGLIVETEGLRVNESSLTGEPYCDKTADPEALDPEATYPSNQALRGTIVLEGRALLQVEAVGDATEIGRVRHQATVFINEQTPLGQQLERLARLISRVAFVVALLVFVGFSAWGLVHEVQWQQNLPHTDYLRLLQVLLQNFMVAVALVVMAVPEGLPMAITLSLAMNMRRMLRTNNLVRRMHACETMGAVSVICTDKTGTLTANHMQVSHFDVAPNLDVALIDEGIAANSTAHLGADHQQLGNPTECALLSYLEAQGKDYHALRLNAEPVARLAFTTERKYMATLVHSNVTGNLVLYVKGAPEVVLQHCNLAPDERAQIEARLRSYQQQAMRTLCFAMTADVQTTTNPEERFAAGGLQYMGLCAIDDPVRPEVPAAIEECRNAGIRIIEVTGDTAGTAIEVARRVGLWTTADDADATRVLTGADFAAMSDDEAFRAVERVKVICRARPLDKERLVEQLQKHGQVVAVTGDGTNDAPALNHADVGLAMGSGTSVAKEAGDITLLDDSFRSIATAVMWGRSIYRNIQRFLIFQLTINVVAVVIVLFGACIGEELPLTVTQMLWINLIMDTFAALALAALPPTPQLMHERPRRRRDFILTPAIRRNIFFTSLLLLAILIPFFWHLTHANGAGGLIAGDERTEQTVFFTTFVMLCFWNLFNAKAFGSGRSAFADLRHCRGFLCVLALILAGQWLIVELGGRVFRTCPLSAKTWLAVVGCSFIVLLAGEAVRFVQNRKARL